MQLSQVDAKRFQVALSFAGENRPFVEGVALSLRDMLGSSSVFYDNFYLHELARPNLDTYLIRIYRDDSELVVLFFCKAYARKEWCGLEWRAVRDIIKTRRDSDVMLFSVASGPLELEGLLSIDGCIEVGHRAPPEVAELICMRVAHRAAAQSGRRVVEVTLDEDFDAFDEHRLRQFASLLRELLGDSSIRLVSKRRGSVVLTLTLSEEQVKELRAATEAGTLRDFRVTSIKPLNAPLALRTAPNTKSANLLQRTTIVAPRRGTPRWALQQFRSSMLPALIEDLSSLEEFGLQDWQCSAVRMCLNGIATSARPLPADGIVHPNFGDDLRIFDALYANWNLVAGHSPSARYARHEALRRLQRQRQQTVKGLKASERQLLLAPAGAGAEEIREFARNAVDTFESLVNEVPETFHALKRACKRFRARDLVEGHRDA